MSDETHPRGVLPDDVIRDAHSTGELLFITLADGIDVAAVETYVRAAHAAVDELCSGSGADQGASACVGFGSRLFARLPSPRPVGLETAAAAAGPTLVEADIVVSTCSAAKRGGWPTSSGRSAW